MKTGPDACANQTDRDNMLTRKLKDLQLMRKPFQIKRKK